jgi:hypothetical protein
MTTVSWMPLGSPGEALSAQPAADATAVAVVSMGGHLYLSRRTDTAWTWDYGGLPPNAQTVGGAVPVPAPPEAPQTVAVAADNGAWLYQPQPTGQPWVSLGGPSGGGVIAVVDMGAPGAPQPTLIMNCDNQLYAHPGLDPTTTWFAIGPDYGTSQTRQIQQFATALATVGTATTPALQVFALLLVDEGVVLRVGQVENSVWRWSEPTGAGSLPPGSDGNGGLSATTIRNAAGALQACAVLGAGPDGDRVGVVVGAGHNWAWTDLGQPPPNQSVNSVVVADQGADPVAGQQPIVLARTGHHYWTRPAGGTWTDHGTVSGDAAVVVPGTALDRTATPHADVWISGVSWASDLWTASLGAAAAWEPHGPAGTIDEVVGAYTDAPMQNLTASPLMVFATDEQAGLWGCQLFVNDGSGQFFSLASQSWTYHGVPAPGINVSSGVGATCQPGPSPVPDDGPPPPSWVFVVGSDAKLYVRTTDQSGWLWTKLGTPVGTLIVNGVGTLVGPGGGPAVHVLGEDGNVYLGLFSGDAWTWQNRNMPRGAAISSLVGAAGTGQATQAVVTTSDGQMWVSDAGLTWRSLGAPPTPQERAVAGIGVQTLDSNPAALCIGVMSAPSNQIWAVQWSPGTAASWTPKGTPNGQTIHNRLSTFCGRPGADGHAPVEIGVVGNDNEVWVSTLTDTSGWTRWDPDKSDPDSNAQSGAVYTFLSGADQRPSGVVLDHTGRVLMMSP